MATPLILVIDPSAVTRSMYGDYFRHAGYDVAEAGDATEGVRLFNELGPRLVVAEVSDEPEWREAMGALRSPEPGRRTPVILCSTRIDPRRPAPPAGIDVDVALAKPVSPRALLLEVSDLLNPVAWARRRG